jgi:hypothetical protein
METKPEAPGFLGFESLIPPPAGIVCPVPSWGPVTFLKKLFSAAFAKTKAAFDRNAANSPKPQDSPSLVPGAEDDHSDASHPRE